MKRNPAVKNSKKGKDVKNAREERKWHKLVEISDQHINRNCQDNNSPDQHHNLRLT